MCRVEMHINTKIFLNALVWRVHVGQLLQNYKLLIFVLSSSIQYWSNTKAGARQRPALPSWGKTLKGKQCKYPQYFIRPVLNIPILWMMRRAGCASWREDHSLGCGAAELRPQTGLSLWALGLSQLSHFLIFRMLPEWPKLKHRDR